MKYEFNCPNCLKTKKNTASFVFIIFTTFLTGIFTSFIFGILAYFCGMDAYDLNRGIQLTTLLGETAYMCWILWQFNNLICTCDEKKFEEYSGD